MSSFPAEARAKIAKLEQQLKACQSQKTQCNSKLAAATKRLEQVKALREGVGSLREAVARRVQPPESAETLQRMIKNYDEQIEIRKRLAQEEPLALPEQKARAQVIERFDAVIARRKQLLAQETPGSDAHRRLQAEIEATEAQRDVTRLELATGRKELGFVDGGYGVLIEDLQAARSHPDCPEAEAAALDAAIEVLQQDRARVKTAIAKESERFESITALVSELEAHLRDADPDNRDQLTELLAEINTHRDADTETQVDGGGETASSWKDSARTAVPLLLAGAGLVQFGPRLTKLFDTTTLKAAQARIQKLEQIIATQDTKVEALNKQIRSLTPQAGTSQPEQQIDALKQAHAAAEATLKQQIQKVHDQNKERDTKHVEIVNQWASKLKTKNAEVKSQKHQLANSKQQIDQLNATIATQHQDAQEAKALRELRFAELTQEVQTAQANAYDAKRKVTIISERLHQKTQETEELKIEKASAFQQEELQRGQAKNQVIKLNQEVDQLKRERDNLTALVSEHDDASLSDLQRKLKEKEEELIALKAELASLKEQFTEQKVLVQVPRAKKQRPEMELIEERKRVLAAYKRLLTSSAALGSEQKNLFRSSMELLNDYDAVVQAKVDAAEASVTELKAKLQTCNSDNAALKAKLDESTAGTGAGAALKTLSAWFPSL
jgi:chromosome segregation ATPase